MCILNAKQPFFAPGSSNRNIFEVIEFDVEVVRLDDRRVENPSNFM